MGGMAATCRADLNRELLLGPENRASHVFLWSFTQLLKARRGQQDYRLWLGRLGAMAKRLTEAWMDRLPEARQEQMEQDPLFLQTLQAAQQEAAQNSMAALGKDGVARLRREWASPRRQRRVQQLLWSDNLMALLA